jgi:hypothetical protein
MPTTGADRDRTDDLSRGTGGHAETASESLFRATTASLEGARAFLRSLARPAGGFRFGPAHDEERWPSMVLAGTYNAVMGLRLLGEAFADPERDLHAATIRSFEADDGAFRMPQMTPDTTFKRDDVAETRTYVDFHVTNYALGALAALDRLLPLRLGFVRPYLDPSFLGGWLARRDLRDPWLEGNNLVNLGSFLLLTAEHGTPDERRAAGAALDAIMAWHERNQDPTTGFWGPRQHVAERDRLHAMAGATHDYHLYYALRRPVPYVEAAVDYCLRRPAVVTSACIDVDIIDILAHAAVLRSHRVAEIEGWCARWLRSAVALQNADGGFPDELDGILRFDGWVAGYWEPQGKSNAFATWFRCIAIAMCVTLLWPGRRSFGFRDMVGIGFARLGTESASDAVVRWDTWTS